MMNGPGSLYAMWLAAPEVFDRGAQYQREREITKQIDSSRWTGPDEPRNTGLRQAVHALFRSLFAGLKR